MRQKQISYDRIDQEIARGEKREPLVGLIILLTSMVIFWGGMWLLYRHFFPAT